MLAMLVVAFVCSTTASARGVIIYGNGDALKTLHELPDSFTNDEGDHFNLGVHYKSFSLFWCPVWNYGDYTYALVDNKEEKYVDLTVEEAKEIAKECKFEIADQPFSASGHSDWSEARCSSCHRSRYLRSDSQQKEKERRGRKRKLKK